ncbi:MAG: YvcK family protein [Coriobacteriia bacterium]|nr:YvcK family protein [Coriobacteriia bacterium]
MDKNSVNLQQSNASIDTEDLEGYRCVVIGGGTGAPVSIRTLLSVNAQVTAVVAMSDDGGSSGLLREQLGILPPGDIRKCLVSMAADQESVWVQAFTQRLPYVNHHPLGNLILSTLLETSGSLPKAIELCEQLLQTRGRVYPSTLESIELVGRTIDGNEITGQAHLTRSENAIHSVCLEPADPEAYQPALQAIIDADLVVLGPGSLFTSIIPNLLVPGVIDAIRQSSAQKVFVCSLADTQGETRGMTAYQHADALLRHGMRGLLDYVVVHDPEPLPDELSYIKRVPVEDDDTERFADLGVRLIVRSLVDPIRPTWHSVEALGRLFIDVMCEVAEA